MKPKSRLLKCSALLSMSLCFVALADEQDQRDGRHRLDLSLTSLDASEADIYTLLPSYTYTLGKQLRLGITASYNYASVPDDEVKDLLGLDSDKGFGDTDVLLQFSPAPELTSSPWVPNTLGLTFGLSVPTGEKGFGGNYWAYRLGLGWAYPITHNFFLIPAAEYESTFAEDNRDLGFEAYGVGLGLYWISDQGFWLGYTPYLDRDSTFREWADEHSLVIGKMWANGFGVGVQYGQRKRLDRTARRDDYTSLLNFYYQFGAPP